MKPEPPLGPNPPPPQAVAKLRQGVRAAGPTVTRDALKQIGAQFAARISSVRSPLSALFALAPPACSELDRACPASGSIRVS